MFRRLCRNALKGDNAALRQAIDLILKLEPEYREKAQVDVKDANINRRKLAERLGLDPEYFLSGPSKPDPTTARLRKQAEAMAKEERKRLIREAQSRGDLPE